MTIGKKKDKLSFAHEQPRKYKTVTMSIKVCLYSCICINRRALLWTKHFPVPNLSHYLIYSTSNNSIFFNSLFGSMSAAWHGINAETPWDSQPEHIIISVKYVPVTSVCVNVILDVLQGEKIVLYAEGPGCWRSYRHPSRARVWVYHQGAGY